MSTVSNFVCSAKECFNMCNNPGFNATLAAEYAAKRAAEAGVPVSYIVGGIALTTAVVALGAYAYNRFTQVAPVKTDVEKALDLYNNGGVKNNLKSRVAFAKIAFFATGRAIANIVKTVFFALTGINANRRNSMRTNANAAVVEIKLATHANLGVIAPSLAQRVQNRA